MDQVMIDHWNAVVGLQDELWHLGDCAVRQSPERIATLLEFCMGRSTSSPATTTMGLSRTAVAGTY
jgi:calcineurin-like phosphoesterase family protein